jgi:hypothetical protein
MPNRAPSRPGFSLPQDPPNTKTANRLSTLRPLALNDQTLDQALRLGQAGIPVFPCTLDKRPHYKKGTLEHGHKDATTNEDQIRAWWKLWPTAAIGVPTGEKTGFFSLDIDIYKPGVTIEKLEALLECPLQNNTTLTISTGNDGRQLYFLNPAGEDLKGIPEDTQLGYGVCVKAAGGYVIVPPSKTTGRYEVLHDAPVAEAPEKLLELLREVSRGTPERSANNRPDAESTAATADLDGPLIYYGSRNDTLAQIAGKLHDGTRSLDQLLLDLEAISRARCVPPLGKHPTDKPGEMKKIARSIYRKPPCKHAAPQVKPEMLEALSGIEYSHLWARKWPGRKMKVTRSVFASLILVTRQYGSLIPAGIRVSLSERDLALLASVSRRAVEAAIRILRLELGILRKDDYGRRLEHSGAFVLLHPNPGVPTCRSKSNQSSTSLSLEYLRRVDPLSGYTLSAARLRCSVPGSGRRLRGTVGGTSKVREGPVAEERDSVIRLDKSAEEVVDWLEATGGLLKIEALAEIVGGRARNLRDRAIAKLEAAGVVVVEDDSVTLVENWLERLDHKRELTGEFEARELDKARYELERGKYCEFLAGEDEDDAGDEPEFAVERGDAAETPATPVTPATPGSEGESLDCLETQPHQAHVEDPASDSGGVIETLKEVLDAAQRHFGLPNLKCEEGCQ